MAFFLPWTCSAPLAKLGISSPVLFPVPTLPALLPTFLDNFLPVLVSQFPLHRTGISSFWKSEISPCQKGFPKVRLGCHCR